MRNDATRRHDDARRSRNERACNRADDVHADAFGMPTYTSAADPPHG